jgi:hypothetical protein
MMEFMPIMFFVFALQVAAGLTLYWIISNTYSFFQQYFTTGWGSLPFLGSRAAASAPANAADDSAAGESAPRAGRQRRKGPGTPPRRRKGR